MRIARSACRLAWLALLATSLVALAPATAQAPAAPDVAKHKAEIGKLSWMVGTWEGEGWSQRGAERIEFLQTERVSLKLDGQTLQVEGEGRSKADASKVAFRALGVVFYDPYANGVRLVSWTQEGHWAVSPMTVDASGFRWELKTPNGTVRYTTKRDGATWNEVGEWSPDGATWSKFIEMNLKKKG